MKTSAMTRRQIILAAAAAGFAIPARVGAQATFGNWTVTSLSDGNLTLPTGFIFDPVDPALAAQVIADFQIADVMTPPCNVTLLQSEGRNVLIDAGAGPEFQASAGSLLDALDEVGLAPEDITDVLITHGHPDHIWGLLDDFDDLTFWNASYQIGQREWDYWTDPDTVDTIGDARATFAVGAARRFERIAEQVTFFGEGDEVLPGIAARATFGHSPGHMAFEVNAGSDSLMILGDCIGNHHVAFAHPDARLGSDQDPDAAATTRVSLLDQLATEQSAVLGFHLPGNGIGRVERDGDAYRFVPTP